MMTMSLDNRTDPLENKTMTLVKNMLSIFLKRIRDIFQPKTLRIRLENLEEKKNFEN